MNKKAFITLLVALAVVAVGWWLHTRSTPAITKITLGSVLPLSGDFAQFGEAIHQGALLAVEEAQSEGVDVEYISQDDQSTPIGSANAANALVNAGNVSGVLTATVQEVKPMASVFNNSAVSLLAVWDSNDYIKAAGPNIFTIGFSTEDAGQKMATHLYETVGATTTAVVSQKDEWSTLIASAFVEKFQQLGGSVVLNESVQPTQKDFRTELTKVKESGAEAIYFPFLPGSIGPFLAQAKQLGIKGTFATGDSMSLDEVAKAQGSAEGLYFTNLHSDKGDALVQKYQAKYNTLPGDPVFVSMGYDGMKTLLAAAQDSQSRQISMADALRKLRIEGTDHEIRFESKQYAEKYERLYKVVGGSFQEVK